MDGPALEVQVNDSPSALSAPRHLVVRRVLSNDTPIPYQHRVLGEYALDGMRARTAPELEPTDSGDLVWSKSWMLRLEHHDLLAQVFGQLVVFLNLGPRKKAGHPLFAEAGELMV